MPRLIEYLSIGICASYGDGDYKVKCSAADLTPEQISEIRQIIPVAIATLEGYFREAMEKHREPAAQAKAIEPINPAAPSGRTG